VLFEQGDKTVLQYLSVSRAVRERGEYNRNRRQRNLYFDEVKARRSDHRYIAPKTPEKTLTAFAER